METNGEFAWHGTLCRVCPRNCRWVLSSKHGSLLSTDVWDHHLQTHPGLISWTSARKGENPRKP
eukprot:scaffold97709_cov17-Tisochrysis_lutea.AAC.1